MINQFGQYVPDYGYAQRSMMPQMPQRYEVLRVNGQNGADTFPMAPHSEALLLDTSAPRIWLKVTDDAGYATCTPYTITPYQPAVPIDTGELLARIEKLEGIVNGKSDTSDAKRKKSSGEE